MYDYHQRKTTDSYRKGWEKAFGKDWQSKTCNELHFIPENKLEVREVNTLSGAKMIETTEQNSLMNKQLNINDPSPVAIDGKTGKEISAWELLKLKMCELAEQKQSSLDNQSTE